MTSKKVLSYEPCAGENIEYAAESAIALAKKEDASVSFFFNEISLCVDANSQKKDVVAAFMSAIDKRADDYRKSPAGQAALSKRQQEVAAKQARLDQQVQNMDAAIQGGLKTLIPWIKQYADDGDDIDVNRHHDTVLKKLVDAGYKSGECTGKDFVKGNKEIMGRYIIGQAVSCMDGSGPFGKMGPHPNLTIRFADEYLAMPDAPSTGSKNSFTL